MGSFSLLLGLTDFLPGFVSCSYLSSFTTATSSVNLLPSVYNVAFSWTAEFVWKCKVRRRGQSANKKLGLLNYHQALEPIRRFTLASSSKQQHFFSLRSAPALL
jgi:hypothetical protein